MLLRPPSACALQPDWITLSPQSNMALPGWVLPLAKWTALAMVIAAAFLSRLFAVIRFESIIHEFDPWFNFRATKYFVEEGFYEFLNWFDTRAWFPLGRIVGGTVYPGLMLTSGALHWFLNTIAMPMDIRNICVFLAPLFSTFTVLATYAFTSEIWDTEAGLFAGAFIGIVPGYISRSVAGSYDNEGIAIFALMFTYFLWIRAMKRGSLFWGAATALSYGYMVSAWGGYVFIINLIPLHVLVLMLMGKCDLKVYTAYTSFIALGFILSMQIPFVGFLPVQTSEHMAALGVFGLIQLYTFFKFGLSTVPQNVQKWIINRFFIGTLAASPVVLFILTWLGFVAPFSGRFYSLYDTGYAKIHIPIIASVSEHQPTPWTSFFMDLHFLMIFFPAGLWILIKKMNSERVFVVLYAVSAVYFAGVMVRLILTLTPIVVVLAAIGISHTLKTFMAPATESKDNKDNKDKKAVTTDTDAAKTASEDSKKAESKKEDVKKNDAEESTENSRSFNRMVIVTLITGFACLFVVHSTWVTSHAYSSPSVVLASQNADGSRFIMDDFREAYYWLRQNTHEDATVMSWWDYGYQIAGFSNRTTLVDNNTWNNSHIALVGMAMSSNESRAYEIMSSLGVDYVLVIFGGVTGYSGDDINKFLWMVRIAEGEHPHEIQENTYFTESGEYKVDSSGSKRMLNCLMYKLSYYRFGEMSLGGAPGTDRARGYEIGNKDIELTYLEEAFTSEHWIVRVYRVKRPHELSNLGKVNEITEAQAKQMRAERMKKAMAASTGFGQQIDPRMLKRPKRS
eukprot:m.561255 g.561255  ORF g.561255 m.561255 type:complete len:793 (-) comp57795_c1_seq2:195-2573(-)